MPLTVDATVGGASANSFVTTSEADTYIEAIPNSSSWTGTTAKDQAVVSATRVLSALTWDGQRTTTTQKLSWPRAYACDVDAPLGSTGYLASDTLPQWLKDATCELAREILKAGTTDVFALPSTDGVIEKTVDVLTTRWADPTYQKEGLLRYPRVWNLIKRNVQGSGPTFAVVRG